MKQIYHSAFMKRGIWHSNARCSLLSTNLEHHGRYRCIGRAIIFGTVGGGKGNQTREGAAMSLWGSSVSSPSRVWNTAPETNAFCVQTSTRSELTTLDSLQSNSECDLMLGDLVLKRKLLNIKP